VDGSQFFGRYLDAARFFQVQLYLTQKLYLLASSKFAPGKVREKNLPKIVATLSLVDAIEEWDSIIL